MLITETLSFARTTGKKMFYETDSTGMSMYRLYGYVNSVLLYAQFKQGICCSLYMTLWRRRNAVILRLYFCLSYA